ncbi:MAG TPA: hypothetical protein VFL98_00235 [Candidatus Paceibacterota bacterium]|nr:hypothetical protein [Candidatus Paceibacterota bacterium]
MNNILFEKTGIKLTDAQVGILRDLFWGFVKAAVLAVLLLIAGLAMHAVTLNCVETVAWGAVSGASDTARINQTHMVAGWMLSIIAAIFVLAFVPFITHGATYLSSLLSNRDFREKEMTASVDFMEDDEREQLITMRATRRAYMVLNFTLSVFWLVSLVTGNFGVAVTLFIVQVIGALSYRQRARSSSNE